MYTQSKANLPHLGQKYESSFDHHPIYSQIGGWVVDEATGELKYKLDRMDWSKKIDGTPSVLTGADGDVMVKVPAFFIKTSKVDGATSFDLDDTIPDLYGSNAKQGFRVHPAFVKEDGTVRPYFLWGAYDGVVKDGKLRSISGDKGTVNKTIGQFRDAARQGRSIDYGIQSIYEWWAIQLLVYFEFGTLDSQAALGRGAADWPWDDGKYPEELVNGMSNALGDRSGYLGENGKGMMRYRGIENLYANLWDFIDGFVLKDDGYYLTNNHKHFGNLDGMHHISKDLTEQVTDGYVTEMESIDGYEFAFIPKAVGGSASTYFCDYFWAHDLGETNIAVAGGHWNNGGHCGVGCLYCDYEVSFRWSSFGARLSYSAQ